MDLSDEMAPRLVTLYKWSDVNSYGFNLKGSATKTEHYFGEIDEGSPAMFSGLKKYDKLIEVNYSNVESLNHADVVNKICTNPLEVTMLIISPVGENYFRSRGEPIASDMPSVRRIVCPERNPNFRRETSTSSTSGSGTDVNNTSNPPSTSYNAKMGVESEVFSSPVSPPATSSSTHSSEPPLELSLSVAEMRERVATTPKRREVLKNQTQSFQEKAKMFHGL